MTEKERERLISMRQELGSQTFVGTLIGRTQKMVSLYETKGAEIPLWYPIVIEELYNRKKAGRRISPA